MFVIGTEVPPPGGARADEHGDIAATTPASAAATMAAHIAAFQAAGLADVVAQIGGLVVQPGVEFSPMQVHDLPMQRDPRLLTALADYPGICLEAHSTDYQHPAVFPRLAQLGFAFQKVGPALTFAYREAIYALDSLRQQAGWATTEPLFTTMERLMLADPGYWTGHYHAASGDLRVQRHFGLADRIRYYWPLPEAAAAVSAVLHDLENRALPTPLLWQGFTPAVIAQAQTIAAPLPQALIQASIQAALMPYFLEAARPDTKEPLQ
jgi:D-tagatose-1,6-bisphosphate aldolase subunit GatZ/KbaZ